MNAWSYLPAEDGSLLIPQSKFRALHEQNKVTAGAQFFQTNLVYDIEGMETWPNELAK